MKFYYRINVYSYIDGSLQECLEFTDKEKAEREALRMRKEVADDLCYLGIEEVYGDD